MRAIATNQLAAARHAVVTRLFAADQDDMRRQRSVVRLVFVSHSSGSRIRTDDWRIMRPLC